MTPFEYEHLWSEDADRVYDALVDPHLLGEVARGAGSHDVIVRIQPGDGTLDVRIESARRMPDGKGSERSVRVVRWSNDRRNATWDHNTLGYEDTISASGSLHLVGLSAHATRLITRGEIHVEAGTMSARLESRLVDVFDKQAEREARLMHRRVERAVVSG